MAKTSMVEKNKRREKLSKQHLAKRTALKKIVMDRDLPIEERLEGTAATVALAVANGASIVRVHDVREMARVVRMVEAVQAATEPGDR